MDSRECVVPFHHAFPMGHVTTMTVQSDERTGLVLITVGAVIISVGTGAVLMTFAFGCCALSFGIWGVGLVFIAAGIALMYSANRQRAYEDYLESIRCPRCGAYMVWWYGRYVCSHCRPEPEEGGPEKAGKETTREEKKIKKKRKRPRKQRVEQKE